MACADCRTGHIHSRTPVGQETTLGDLPAYATGNEDSERIIVFATDVFGWTLANARPLADEYAARRFRVLVPDLFGGNNLPKWALTASEHTDKATLLQRVLRPFLIFLFIPFLLRNTHASHTAKLTGVIAHLRTTRPDARIGIVGFCWGGRYAITLNHLCDATATCHPSRVAFPEELVDVSNPISFAVAETDKQFNEKREGEREAFLRGRLQ